MAINSLASLLIIGGNLEQRRIQAEEVLAIKISQAANNPDFLYLSAKTGLGIEEVRNLQTWLSRKPFKEKKAVFIEEAQELSLEAQNALLKILEEPPPVTIIVLSTPESSLLLPTILSRCQIISLPAQSQVFLTDEEIKTMEETLDQLFNATPGERLVLAESLGLYQDRDLAIAWLDKLTFVIRKKMLSSFLNDKQLTKQSSSNNSMTQLLEVLAAVAKTKSLLKANVNLRLAFDVFLLDLPLENC